MPEYTIGAARFRPFKAEGLGNGQKEDLVGELSVSISSLRIKTELIEEDWETTEDIVL